MQRQSPYLAAGLLAAILGFQALDSVFAQEAVKNESSAAAIRQYRAAVALQNRELFDLASDEWRRFLEQFADDPLAGSAMHYLGVCLLQTQDYEKAAETFQQVTAEFPSFEKLDATYFYQGLAQYQLGKLGNSDNFGRAAATFASLVAKQPSSSFVPQALYYRGEAYYALGDRPKAINEYQRLVENYPNHELNADALYALGVAQEEAGQPQEAGVTYNEFLKRHSEHGLATEVEMRLGETHFARGDYEAAQRRFISAASIEGFALADHALSRLAATYYEMKRFSEAGQAYAKLVNQYPQSGYSTASRLAAGNCFYLAQDYEEARDWFAKVIELNDPGSLEAAHWTARSFLRQDRPDDAVKTVKSALASTGAAESPYYTRLLMDEADGLYEISGQREQAISKYSAIADRFPEDGQAPQARYMSAFAALGTGKYAAAEKEAEKFLATFEDHELAPDVLNVAAEADLQLKEYARAEQRLARLAAEYGNDPRAPSWWVRHAFALHLQGKHADVVRALRERVESISDAKIQAEAYFLLGTSYQSLENNELALEALTASLEVARAWSRADEVLLALARSYRAVDDLGNAKAAAARLINEFPESKLLDRAHYRLAEYAQSEGDHEVAAREYALVLSNWPNSDLAQYAVFGLGWTNLAQGKAGQAEEVFSRFVNQSSGHELEPKVRYGRAVARQRAGKYEDAIADASAFLDSNPTGTDLWDAMLVLGLSQAGVEKHAEAIQTFSTILADNPGFGAADQVLYEIAWVYKESGQNQKSVESFQRLANNHPESSFAAEAHYHLGENLYEQKEYQEAGEAYLKALEKADTVEIGEKAGHKLGWSFFQLGDYDTAQSSFAYQVQQYPEGDLIGDGLFMLAETLFKQSKFSEALNTYSQAQTRKQSSDDFETLSLLHSAQAAGQLKRWELAQKLLQRCVEQHRETPYMPEVQFEQGWVLQNLGEHDAAIEKYTAVVESTQREVAARAEFMIGEIMFARKDHSEAVRHFFKAAYGYAYPKWQAEATFEAARCLEVLEKPEQARDTYLELIEKFPQSDRVAAARKRLETLSALQ